MNKKVRLSSRKVTEINRKNAHGKKWAHKNGNEINPDYIVKCYDLYKQGRMTSRQLFGCFPGRTMKAIESKVWKIRGRAELDEYYDPNQTNLFTELLNGL
jgi:hypothetical protein